MKVVKIYLISKNNKQNGFYLYMPICLVDNKYYRGQSIKTNKVIKLIDVNLNDVKNLILIPDAYLKEFGL